MLALLKHAGFSVPRPHDSHDKQIAFCPNRGGSFELYRMSLERSEVVQLTGKAAH